jgi:hypothetical protein
LSTSNFSKIVKTEKKMSGVLFEIQTGNIPSTNQKLVQDYVFGSSRFKEWVADVEGSVC